MLGAVIGVEVAAYVDDASGEGCQRILVNALAGAPVHLGQRIGAKPGNYVLRTLSGDIIACGTSETAITAELRQNLLSNWGHKNPSFLFSFYPSLAQHQMQTNQHFTK